MYGMTSNGKLSADDLTQWLLEAGSIQSQYQMSIYYKYSPDGTNIIDLSYVDDRVYWYTSEALGRWFVYNLINIFHVNLLGYSNWFMSIIIYHIKDPSIYVDQARYANYIIAKYLDTATVNKSKKFYKIFVKSDASISDEQVQKLSG